MNSTNQTPPNGNHGDNANPQGGYIQSIRQAADWLFDQNKIGTYFDRHKNYPRYADLELQPMFNSLVLLYTNIFTSFWSHLQRAAEVPEAYAGFEPTYLATCYISAWIHDLYVANRRATLRICPQACNKYYTMDLTSKINEYDSFLAVLQATIRPTPVHFTHESTLFIPRFGENTNPAALDENYFKIEGFVINDNAVHSVLQINSQRRLFNVEPTIETGFGRVSWLFDYHGSRAYAWFPRENNYDERDTAIAYIVGVACTAKLGPSDRDEWQLFPGNVVPEKLDVRNYRRVLPITYHGAVEVHTIEQGTLCLTTAYLNQVRVTATLTPPQQTESSSPQQKGKTQKGRRPKNPAKKPRSAPENEGSSETTVIGEGVPTQPSPHTSNTLYSLAANPINRYRITTYLYRNQVTAHEDVHSRNTALRLALKPLV